MHFLIEKENFIKILKIISGVADKKVGQDSQLLNSCLLEVNAEGLFITSTDLDIEVGAFSPVKETIEFGRAAVLFRKLYDIVRSFPNDKIITLKIMENRLALRAGKSKFMLATTAADKFPEQNVKKWDLSINILEKDLVLLLNKTIYAIAEQDVRYYLNGLFLEVKDRKLYAVGADGHRLAVNCIELEQNITYPIQIIIPRKSVMELTRILEAKEQNITIKFSKNRILVSNDAFKFSSKLLEGRFPDYNAVIPKNLTLEFIGKRDLLREVFLRASALFTEKIHNLKINLSKNHLQIVAKTKEQDEVEEELEIEYVGPNFSLGFNGKYLLDFITATKADTVKFRFSEQKNSAAVLEAVGDKLGFYVLMPIRE